MRDTAPAVGVGAGPSSYRGPSASTTVLVRSGVTVNPSKTRLLRGPRSAADILNIAGNAYSRTWAPSAVISRMNGSIRRCAVVAVAGVRSPSLVHR